MSSKGFPTQKKLNSPIPGVTTKFTKDQFQTYQPSYSDQILADVAPKGVFRLSSLLQVTAASTIAPKRAFTMTAHGGSVGDLVKFEPTGAANPGFEATIVDVPDANTIVLGAEAPNNIATSDDFYILRYVSQRFDDSGSAIVTANAGPVQFVLDGVDTEVEQDTAVPANSIPLPIVPLNTSGVPQNVATLGEQQTQTTAINTLLKPADTLTAVTTVGAVTQITNALPAGTNVIGALSADQSVNVTQLGGTAISRLGGATDAGTQRVVLSDTQPTLTVTSTSASADAQESGNITTQNLGPSGAGTVGSLVQITTQKLRGRGSVIVYVSGTYTGALSLQVSSDSSTWTTVSSATNFYNISTQAYSATIPSGETGVYLVSIAGGLVDMRVTALAAVTGTAAVILRSAEVANGVVLGAPIPTGSNIIGALAANQSTNVAQMNGVAVTMGNGVSGTGVQRVTIASDSTGAIKQGGKSVVTTVRNDYTSTSVTTGAWVQLVASTSAEVSEIDIFDSSGQTLELGTGAAASETRLVIITPGGNGKLSTAIPASTRISVRAISGTASVGELDINMFGT